MLIPVSIARSGFIASGNVGWPHLASGAVRSGHLGTTETPDGTKFLRDDFSWRTVSVTLNSGDVGSGKIASGAVQGFFGATRHIASGTVGVFDFGSGAVIAGAVGSGAVVSGNIASGQVGRFHIASGQLEGFELGSGAIVSGRIASGQIGDGHIASGQIQGLVTKFSIGSGTFTGFELGSGAIVSGRIASGQIGRFHIASGQLAGFELGSGAIVSGRVASGQIGDSHIASGAIRSGHILSGALMSGNLGFGSPDATKFLNGDFEWTSPGAATINSGDVGSGKIASGAVQGFFGATRHIASGTVGVFDFGSGAVIAGAVGSGAIRSGNIGSGQIGRRHFAPESITTVFGAFESGTITRNEMGSGAIQSQHFASGAAPVTQAVVLSGVQFINDGASTSYPITNERISGCRAVCFDGSGNIQIAMASIATRRPAIGVVVHNVESGEQATVLTHGFQGGRNASLSGLFEFSGYIPGPVLLGRSGQLVTTSGWFNSGGLLSGDIYQVLGHAFLGSGLFLQVQGAAVSGGPHLGSGAVQAGSLGSGAVVGFHGQDPSNIASGTVGTFDLAVGGVGTDHILDGAIVSGKISSGQIGRFHIASGRLAGFELGSGAIVSGRIASGQLGDGHYASGSVQGLVTKFTVASGTFTGFELGSGAIVSGRVASGQIGRFHIASGQLEGFELGSGSIVSGRIASGQVGNFHLSSGSVTSGRLGVNPATAPDGTKFLRDDFSWQSPGAASVNSGDIGQDKMASGNAAKLTATIVSGYNNPLISGMTEERISGVRAVTISQSGNIRIAKASVSGLMPAIGVVMNNVESGIQVNVYQFGLLRPSSGLVECSGYGAQLLYVGRSGQVVTASGGFNSGGLLSGDIVQPIGVVAQTFSGVDGDDILHIGVTPQLPFVPSLVLSGDIASGQLGTFHLSSGCVVDNSTNSLPVTSGEAPFMITSEMISGIKAVCIDRSMSGLSVRIARALTSGRMPAIGVVTENVDSGLRCNIQIDGIVYMRSGMIGSGFHPGRRVWVGHSGDLIIVSGGVGSGNFASGAVIQQMGTIMTNASGNTSGVILLRIGHAGGSGLYIAPVQLPVLT